MKSTEDYINKVYEKFEETQKNHIYYKPVKIKENNAVAIISSVAICLVLLFTIAHTKWQNVKEVAKSENSNINYVEAIEDGTKTYIQYLNVDVNYKLTEDNLKKLKEASDLIAIISGYNKRSNEIVEDENFTIYTNSDINIEKIYKINRELDSKKITYGEIGGKLLIRDFESKYNYDWDAWEKDYLGNILSEEEKEITYFEQIPTRKIELQPNTKYLMFLRYKKDIDSYVSVKSIYGALEYDSDTNMVKNPMTGEFEEFDWSILDN